MELLLLRKMIRASVIAPSAGKVHLVKSNYVSTFFGGDALIVNFFEHPNCQIFFYSGNP